MLIIPIVVMKGFTLTLVMIRPFAGRGPNRIGVLR